MRDTRSLFAALIPGIIQALLPDRPKAADRDHGEECDQGEECGLGGWRHAAGRAGWRVGYSFRSTTIASACKLRMRRVIRRAAVIGWVWERHYAFGSSTAVSRRWGQMRVRTHGAGIHRALQECARKEGCAEADHASADQGKGQQVEVITSEHAGSPPRRL
jgi:hypothetical protein